MPEIGEIRKAQEIGKKGWASYMWHPCMQCGKPRWEVLIKRQPKALYCLQCACRSAKVRAHNSEVHKGLQVGEKNSAWKGGRTSNWGYIQIRVPQTDFFSPMADKRHYVFEHRLVMARHLNRCLLPWEIVHHKNGVRDDNRIENLELLPSKKYHVVDSLIKSRISNLQAQVRRLISENESLKHQLASE